MTATAVITGVPHDCEAGIHVIASDLGGFN